MTVIYLAVLYWDTSYIQMHICNGVHAQTRQFSKHNLGPLKIMPFPQRSISIDPKLDVDVVLTFRHPVEPLLASVQSVAVA